MMNGDENQLSNEQDDSEEDNGTFLDRIRAPKDQYKLKPSFRSSVDAIVKYLQNLKELTDAIQTMCLSGKSYHFDQKLEVQNSGWRYMPNYLKKVEFIKNNRSEAESLWRLCDKLGQIEEDHFYEILHVEHDSNIYYTATKQRAEIDRLYDSVEKEVKTCNRRRARVEKAILLRDLKTQGPKYQKAVAQLDQDTRMLSNNQTFVRENRAFHRTHFKQSSGYSEIDNFEKYFDIRGIEEKTKKEGPKQKKQKKFKSQR